MVTTRRAALLGAGTLLLAGCGPPDEPEVDAAQVWGEQLRVSQAALAAYPSGISPRVAASDRVDRLAALAGATGETPTAAPSLEAALEAERVALQTHVAAVGQLDDRVSREVLAELVAGTAEAVSALRKLMDEPPIVDSFPGQRNRP
jgi:hypothetical protein